MKENKATCCTYLYRPARHVQKGVENASYSTILFLGSNGGGKSVSPSISLKSISAVRHICEIGTSFALPSNGFSVLSPTRSSEVYI